MATHSSILARKIPCTEKPGRLQSRVGGVIFSNIQGLGFCEQSHGTFGPDTRSAFSRTG